MNQWEAKKGLSRWMKSTRIKLRKNQANLARELECSGVHISQIERGRRMPSNELLLKMSQLAECNQREVRGLLLLRTRAGSDVTPEDFGELFGDTGDMLVVVGSMNTQRFLDVMRDAEHALPKEEFALLSGAVMQIVEFAKKRSQRQLQS